MTEVIELGSRTEIREREDRYALTILAALKDLGLTLTKDGIEHRIDNTHQNVDRLTVIRATVHQAKLIRELQGK